MCQHNICLRLKIKILIIKFPIWNNHKSIELHRVDTFWTFLRASIGRCHYCPKSKGNFDFTNAPEGVILVNMQETFIDYLRNVYLQCICTNVPAIPKILEMDFLNKISFFYLQNVCWQSMIRQAETCTPTSTSRACIEHAVVIPHLSMERLEGSSIFNSKHATVCVELSFHVRGCLGKHWDLKAAWRTKGDQTVT